MSKGSTQVKPADPYEVADADVRYNRIDQFTPLNSLQFYGPERNKAVETLNPMLQENENRRMMSDRMLMDMALGRQGDMKGGSLPSLVPGLMTGGDQGVPTDPASNVPYVPDFIGNFQGNPQSMGQGNPKGGAQQQAPAPNMGGGGDKAGMQQQAMGALGGAKGGAQAAPQAAPPAKGGQGGGVPGGTAADAIQGAQGQIGADVQRDYDKWMGKWGGGGKRGYGDEAGALNMALTGDLGGSFGLSKLLGGDKEPKRGSLPGTEWQRDAQGKIAATDGEGHWNPIMGQYVDRRGRPKSNQAAPPTVQPTQGQFQDAVGPAMGAGGLESFKGGAGGAPLAAAPQLPGKGGAQAAPQPAGVAAPQAQSAAGGDPAAPGGISGIQMGLQEKMEQAMFDRSYGMLESKFGQQESRMNQDLANRGIPRDSEAGQRELAGFRQSQGNTLAGMSQDAVQQGLTAQLQNANMISTNRATQFNELASLLGLNQVAQPGLQNFFAPANADVGGAFALNQQGQATNANNNQQAKNGMMDAIGSVGGGMAMASDRRIKRDVHYIGDAYDQKWYEFEYIWDEIGKKSVGVMSDEVPQEMVVPHPDGYDMVDYAKVLKWHK